MNTNENKMLAIWKYHTFPYYLCAYVVEFRPNGTVKVDGYGGHTFNPIKLLWGEKAEAFVTETNKIKKLQHEETIALRDHWDRVAYILLNGETTKL